MDSVLDGINGAIRAALLLLVVGAMVAIVVWWLRPPTRTGIAAVAAVAAFLLLGWTYGNRINGLRFTEPVSWPLHIPLVGALPAVEGACSSYVEPGWYEEEINDGRQIRTYEITEEEAARYNADVRACRADAHRTNRDETNAGANGVSVLLLVIAVVAGRDHLGRRRQARAIGILRDWLERQDSRVRDGQAE
jgi:hypothetical protein